MVQETNCYTFVCNRCSHCALLDHTTYFFFWLIILIVKIQLFLSRVNKFMNLVINIKQQVTLYLLLAVYAFALVRPILPVVTDVVAHTFFKMQHMATVHVSYSTTQGLTRLVCSPGRSMGRFCFLFINSITILL
jgi:hypothetical protein